MLRHEVLKKCIPKKKLISQESKYGTFTLIILSQSIRAIGDKKSFIM